MLPLYDMMMKAQNGRFAELLARQVNLSRQQAELALEAVLPAFSEALRRSAADPFGFTKLMTAMGSGQYAPYFEDAGKAFAPEGLTAGNQVLDQLFGTKDLSRAVSEQAAKATGIAQDAYRQMLPAMAAMMMGGFFKQATGQMAGTGANPFLEAFQKMMPQAAPAGQATANPYAQMMENMFGKNATGGTQAELLAANPFYRMYQDWLATAQPKPEPTNPSGRPRTSYDDMFGEMFETGRRQRAEYDEAMRKMVGDFLSRPT